jgi:hypothetical protein
LAQILVQILDPNVETKKEANVVGRVVYRRRVFE